MQSIFNHKKILVIIILIILVFVGYGFYVSNKKSSNANVSKQSVTASSVQASLEGPGKEFVTQLLAIQNINFKLDLFKDPVYIGLQDFSREIIPQPIGRPNPFAPFDDESRTNSPTNISEIKMETVSENTTPVSKPTVTKASATSTSKTNTVTKPATNKK